MSSLSTLPKGDSAWLLRKAIERIIQQISVLETNIGSSTTGNSANTQIIFNDNGVLRGDAGLTYNATTDLLTVASATITGDLTVDTSTLKVDSANNRVIVGHTSGSAPFQVTNAGAAGLELHPTGASSAPLIISYNRSGLTYTQLTIDASTIVHQLGGSTAMTLNSTGLGVGRTPAYKLDVSAPNGNGIRYRAEGSNATIYMGDFSGVPAISTGTNSPIIFGIDGGEAMRIDTSRNVGVGVTPSAWQSNFKAFELGRVGNAIATYTAAGGAADLYISSNAYYNGGFKYANSSQTAGLYSVTGNVHAWFTAASGTAGNAITDFATAKMTLDASGNLLVGKTAVGATTRGFEVIGATGLVNSTVANDTNSVATFAAYSTVAAAYRFYVGLAGTVFATNTTISAISDARLKENVQDIDVGLSAILALKPRKFDWKAGKGKDIKGDRGFIAQEFEQVFPQLVDDWADPAPEGEASYKSVRQDLIPVLVKAIQELTARVQTLEAK